MRRTMNSGSSPASIMRASQYSAPSGSEPRRLLDEGADRVVVGVALAVVEVGAVLQRLFDDRRA